jgi:transketolase
LKLGKLIYLYDDNHISIEGSTDLTFTENRLGRFQAYGWHVEQVDDGNSIEAIEKAIREAQGKQDQPSLIAVRTHIGYGSPNKQDSASAHGEPLGAEETRLTKENLGWPLEPQFFIPDEALQQFRGAIEKGERWEKEWRDRFRSYEKAHSDLALEWDRWFNNEISDETDKGIPTFPADSKGMATRVASGTVLNAIASTLPNLIGGSADLAPSNKTFIDGAEAFQGGTYQGRNFHFGVREHGMGSILNGMALHGGLIPYGGTFLVFSDYMRPPIRLAAMMGLRVIYIFTHDSIGLGEDGPTHQPIEQLIALRAIPNLTVIRPCDANETAQAWRSALKIKDGPVALALSRQNVPTLDRQEFASADGLHRGAYILKDSKGKKPDVILIASGSEVQIGLDASSILEEKGISARVVSMPSWELFDSQPEEYTNEVLPPDIEVRVTIEAGVTQGWHRYLGNRDGAIGIDHFGASAPSTILYEKFGITVERVVERVLRLLREH